MASPIEPTLGNAMRYDMLIKVKCPRCGHKVDLEPRAMAKTMDWRTDFRRLRFKCTACGRRRIQAIGVPRDW